MKINRGTIDRIIRVTLAVVVGILYVSGKISGIAAVILGLFAVAFLLTSAFGFCPLYVPLGISTLGKNELCFGTSSGSIFFTNQTNTSDILIFFSSSLQA